MWMEKLMFMGNHNEMKLDGGVGEIIDRSDSHY
jgi:hypothetical protein